MHLPQPLRKQRKAFSLIELVVVLMILAIVSGLVVAIAGWVRRSANYAALSHNQASIMSNLEYYRTTFGNNGYPDFMDSLLKADGTVPTYMDADLQDMLTPTAINADQAGCLNFLTTVMDHLDETDIGTALQGNPGNSGTITRSVADGGTLAFVDTTSGNGALLEAEIYPDGVPADVSLVALGVGPSNKALGRTMQTPPFDTRIDNSQVYGRFIAVFAVYSPRQGRRGQLKAVLSARGRTQNNGLSEFWQSTNPE